MDLNYHHLRYFHAVAHEGSLTRAARRLNVSQSALSVQIRDLEERLGRPLFERTGRSLTLTEVGRIALDHADRIFETGAELVATIRQSGAAIPPLRVGALSTLSRNFQMRFLEPVLSDAGINLILRSGHESALVEALRSLALDVVLSTEPAMAPDVLAVRISEQPVSIHGIPERLQHSDLTSLLRSEPIILPTERSIRAGFAGLADRLGVTPHILAEVDDMAMVRLLALSGAGLAVAPSVVLADELAAGRLSTAPFKLDVSEAFYALTVRRSFPHPSLADLLKAAVANG